MTRNNCRSCEPSLDCNGNPIVDLRIQNDCWFTPEPKNTKQVHPSNPVDATGLRAVFFTSVAGDPIDVKVTFEGESTPFPVAAGTALGLSTSTQKFTVDKSAIMFAMGR